MKRKNRARLCFLAAAVGILAVGYALAQETPPEWVEKAKAAAERLAKFVPEPASGLLDRLPWEPETEWPRILYGCGETGCSGLFAPAHAERTWRFDDPALVKQVEAAENEGKSRLEAFTQRTQQGNVPPEEMTKAMQELEKLDSRLADLKGRARSLEFTIAGNATPEWCSGELGTPVRSGALKGQSLYRVAKTVPQFGPALELVCLEVYVGPGGFKNPPAPRGGALRAELKCILIKAKVISTPQSVKADEAVARRLLETVDYDGLARLLQP